MKAMNRIPHPLVLSNALVELIPLERGHFDEIISLAKDERIWKYYVLDGSDPEIMLPTLEDALAEREAGRQYPFVITLKEDGKIIGSTRFMDIQPAHRKLEIGWTWLHPDYWGTAINAVCKQLLLRYCFEELGTYRVQLKTDELNIRSRRAIEKLSARFEGILRNDMVRQNGTRRNSAYYSIIEEEWLRQPDKE
jgi:RimJ/RimL family protein N-acetyltransferase